MLPNEENKIEMVTLPNSHKQLTKYITKSKRDFSIGLGDTIALYLIILSCGAGILPGMECHTWTNPLRVFLWH